MACAIWPHVVSAHRVADLFAIGLPMFIPSEPLIHKAVWTLNNVFGGRGANLDIEKVDFRTLRAPWVDPASFPHPYSIIDFQLTEDFLVERFFEERSYWLQYSEWTEPWRSKCMFHYKSAVDLYTQAQELSFEEFVAQSVCMQNRQIQAVQSAIEWWRYVLF